MELDAAEGLELVDALGDAYAMAVRVVREEGGSTRKAETIIHAMEAIIDGFSGDNKWLQERPDD